MTDLEICNIALMRIGSSPIDSFSVNSTSARLANANYTLVLNSLLSCYPWRFSTRTLTKETSINSTTEDYQYFADLEDDIIFVQKVVSEDKKTIRDYQISENKIFCNQNIITITATIKADSEDFPPYFTEALVANLSKSFALSLSENLNIFDRLKAESQQALVAAKTYEAFSAKAKTVQSNVLTEVRK